MLRGIFTLLFCLMLASPAAAKPLVADMSRHVVEIDTEFTGTELLIFGVRNAPGDIVVVVRGPERNYTVWRKQRVAGMWANRKLAVLEETPDFYLTAATRPIEEIADPILRRQLGLGGDQAMQALETGREVALSPEIQAFVQDQRRMGKYRRLKGIDFMGDSLFKAVVPFPDRILRGIYTAEVYLIRDGRLQASQMTPLVVRKRGLDARVYDYAHRHPWFYGLLAVSLALMVGWIVSALFNRK